MVKIEFLVQGSQVEPYIVTFSKHDDNFIATCTCAAGENGMYCKHRFNILSGIKSNIVSANLEDVNEIMKWMPGSSVETAMLNVARAEADMVSAKQNLNNLKKKLAAVMLGKY